MRQPTFYLPHGAGPCFFMEWRMGPPDTWDPLAAWLRSLPTTLPEPPRALLVVSAHWEAPTVSVTTSPAPDLLFDYYGFPPHTYELSWPAPGDPALAARIEALLGAAGIESRGDASRGFDHGVFVPMLVAWPAARVPTVQVSLKAGLDPEAHLALGRALAPLRDEGVLILGSGMSYHHMRPDPRRVASDSQAFDDWMVATSAEIGATRDAAMRDWLRAPAARDCHPREEHLVPWMVVAGAASEAAGVRAWTGHALGARLSAIRFG